MNFTKNIFLYPILISLILIGIIFTPVYAGPPNQEVSQTEIDAAIMSGIDYLKSQINSDGGIRWFDDNSNTAATLRVVQALAAAELSQNLIISEAGKSPIDFLAEKGESWINQQDSENPDFNVGRAGQLLTAIAAGNKNPHSFGENSLDLIASINTTYDVNTGTYGGAELDNVTDQVWAMIGLAANNASIPMAASDWLISAQTEDGSWDDGFGSYFDTTPLGLLALISSGHLDVNSLEIQAAITYMSENQHNDGGWQSDWDTGTNANITGVMLQAIYSLGHQPDDEFWQKPGGNPETALLSIQQESGALGGDFANAFSTADAIVGLAGCSLTDLGSLERVSDSFDYLISMQENNGSWGSVGQTLDVILAVESAGWDPNSIIKADQTPMDYIASNIDPYIEMGPDAIGKTILGLTAAGFDPSEFNGFNLTQSLMNTYREDTKAFGTANNTWHQAFGILGMHAAGEAIPVGSIKTLVDLQQDDGGWEYAQGFGTGADSTAMAIQALIAAKFTKEDAPIANALNYIRSKQQNDGDWGDSITTAFVIMALNALDEPQELWVTDSSKSPFKNLFSYQKANGAFYFNKEFPDNSIMATSTAMLVTFGGDYIVDAKTDDSKKQASIIVIPGDGLIYADCVEFEGESISGLSLLELSDFSYITTEGLISSIMDITNLEGDTNYWAYWSWDGREWKFKTIGAGKSIVLPGSVEAWHFTSWEVFPSLPPDFPPDIDQICKAPVLKNYPEQPNLSYNDLFNVEMVNFEASNHIDEPTEEDTVDQYPKLEVEAIKTESNNNEINNQEIEKSRSLIPLYIILSLGVVLFMIFYFFILRKPR